MRQAVIFLLAVILASCQTPKPPVNVPGHREPCPVEALAPIRAEPASPEQDGVERGKVFGAITAAIGEERARALVRFWEVEMPTWGRQGWERGTRVKEWCDRPRP